MKILRRMQSINVINKDGRGHYYSLRKGIAREFGNFVSTAREFDEDEHPRGGDPEHPGRFSDKGGGGSSGSKISDATSPDSIRRKERDITNAKMSDNVKKHIKDYEYIAKSDLPNLNNLYYKEGILSEIANDIAAENKDKLKQFQFRHTSGFSIMMGDTRITESEIPKYYQVLKKIRQIIPKKIHDMVDLENNKIKEKWKNGDSLFRGANEKELWDYLANDNIVGSGKTWKTAGNREETQFVPTSLNRDYAARHVKEGRGHVLLEFEGGQQDSAPVTYEMRGLTEVIDEDGKTYRPGEKYDNSTHPIEFMHEEEIHLRQGSTRKLKSIQFQSTDPNDIERFKNNLSKYDMSDTEIRYGISDQGKEFIEDEHPRGGDSEHPGRFSDKDGNKSGGSEDKEEEEGFNSKEANYQSHSEKGWKYLTPKGNTTIRDLLDAVRKIDSLAKITNGDEIPIGNPNEARQIWIYLDKNHTNLDYNLRTY